MEIRGIDALLMPVWFVGAVVAGLYLPYRLIGSRPGYRMAVTACSPLTIFHSIILATLTGGWGEEYLGTTCGVPLGVIVGSFVMSFSLNLLAGSVAAVFCTNCSPEPCEVGSKNPI